MEKVVIDSYAMLAYFNAEPAGRVVFHILEEARDENVVLYLSLINLGEIYYIVYRQRGREKAIAILEALRLMPITISEINKARVLAAADIKAQYPISYADAFAAALCQELDAELVTGDPEFKVLETVITVKWLVPK